MSKYNATPNENGNKKREYLIANKISALTITTNPTPNENSKITSQYWFLKAKNLCLSKITYEKAPAEISFNMKNLAK